MITADEALQLEIYDKALNWFWLRVMFRTTILMISEIMLKDWLTMLSESYSKSFKFTEAY
jgi:hypothetical protein